MLKYSYRFRHDTICFSPKCFYYNTTNTKRFAMPEGCPRCDTALERLQLGDVETISCPACGYADIDVDHSGEPVRIESWDDALERFENENNS